MKDKQAEPPSGQPRIPFISAALHCVAMTAVVYLRSSFGYVYLRPKSVFFAFTWAFALFLVYAWTEPGAWRQYRAICLFGAGAAILYWFHLLRSFVSEIYRHGEHDHYSGTSHLIRIVRRSGKPPEAHEELNVQLWAEPGLLLAACLFFRVGLGERHLSAWLVVAAVCLWIKEAFNHWFHLRQRKRQADMFKDTGESMDDVEPPEPESTLKPTRVPKKHRPRNTSEAEVAEK